MLNVLNFIDNNFMVCVAIVVIIVGIVLKIYKFFNQTVEDQKKQIKEEVANIKSYIKECLLDLVTNAENKYGSGTGVIKKSVVYKELMELLPSLEDYITDGDMTTDEIGELIDEAVEFINSKAKSNQKILSVFNKE